MNKYDDEYDEEDEEECAECGRMFIPSDGASGRPMRCLDCWEVEGFELG